MSETKIYYPAIDEAIAAYLRRNDMTQSQLAAKMGMAENTFSWKRRGVREWSLTEAARICPMVGIRLEDAVAEMVTGADGAQEAVA